MLTNKPGSCRVFCVCACKPLLTRYVSDCGKVWPVSRSRSIFILFNCLICMGLILFCWRDWRLRRPFSWLVGRQEVANITPVPRERRRLPRLVARTIAGCDFIRMMNREIKGIGTKEWAGFPAPFFVRRKVRDPHKAGLLAVAGGMRFSAPDAAACLSHHPIPRHRPRPLSSR